MPSIKFLFTNYTIKCIKNYNYFNLIVIITSLCLCLDIFLIKTRKYNLKILKVNHPDVAFVAPILLGLLDTVVYCVGAIKYLALLSTHFHRGVGSCQSWS